MKDQRQHHQENMRQRIKKGARSLESQKNIMIFLSALNHIIEKFAQPTQRGNYQAPIAGCRRC